MQKVVIIAEAGVNHNGSIDLAKALIEKAASAGADYVKFQTFKADKLVSKQARKAEYQIANQLNESESQYDMLKKLELTEEDHVILLDYAKQKGISFLSTGFDEESIDMLERIGAAPFYKIPSGEITNKPYLRHIAAKKKPVIVSTGMANMDEIYAALNVLQQEGLPLAQISVLHCNTEYPTPFCDVNLAALQTIRNTFRVKVGYSDHTKGIEVAIAAVALGAEIIEKHFTLDHTLPGPDHSSSLEPSELNAMVTSIRNIQQAIGNGIKQPSDSEIKNLTAARKSIHLKSDVKAGHVIELSDLIMMRPGNGISPMNIDSVIGKRLLRDMIEKEKLSTSDYA